MRMSYTKTQTIRADGTDKKRTPPQSLPVPSAEPDRPSVPRILSRYLLCTHHTHLQHTRRRGDAGPADLPDEEGGFLYWVLGVEGWVLPGGGAVLDFKGGGLGQKF